MALENEWEQLEDGRIVVWLQKPERLDYQFQLYTVISEESFDAVDSISGKWCASFDISGKLWYVSKNHGGKYMQSFLLGTSRKTRTNADHICIPDTMNNTLDNLRELSYSESSSHTRKRENTASKYRGVCRNRNRWMVRISENNILQYLGIFATEDEAGAVANAYYEEHAPVSVPTPPDAIYIQDSRSIFPVVPDHIYERAGILRLKQPYMQTT